MADTGDLPGRLRAELFTECAGWIWEQLQEEGLFIAGELVEEVLVTERRLGLQREHAPGLATSIVHALPGTVLTAAQVEAVLGWEDEFLGLAGIPRAES